MTDPNHESRLADDHGVISEGSVAAAFIAAHKNRLKYDHTAGAWYEWTGTHWRRDDTCKAFRWAHDQARAMASPTGKDRTIIAAGKAGFAAGVERLAQADRALATTAAIWDTDDFLLGTPGGTIDLTSGKLRLADPGDHITKQTSVAPADAADCPMFLEFIDQAMSGDRAKVDYLQRFFGYALTGCTEEHAMLFAWGPGGNGKGTFTNTVARIMGDYATTAAMDSFVVTRSDRHSTDIAMLAGARLAITSEVEENQTWAASKIQTLTGGDPVTARFMRRDNFTFRPRFKLCISGNHKPKLVSVTDAMRRRLNLVPFINKPAEPDRQLQERMAETELPGILRWLLDGCLAWQRRGLAPPDSVLEATADYFEGQDHFAQWLAECCILDPYLRTPPAALHQSYQAWCQANGEPEGDGKAFRGLIERQGGLSYGKSNGKRLVRGVGLNAPQSASNGRYPDA